MSTNDFVANGGLHSSDSNKKKFVANQPQKIIQQPQN